MELGTKKEIWSWALYDFANSPFSTSVASVIFNVYFVQVVVGPAGTQFGAVSVPGTSMWGFAVAASMLLVAVSAPVLGAVADQGASKKRFLFVFCYSGVIATALLYLVEPGDVWLAVGLYIVANLGFEGSFTFYNAFLPELVDRERMGRVSGLGWAVGYIAGPLVLALNLAMIQRPEWFGLSASNHTPVRASMVVVAVWWAVFAIPIFLWVRERAPAPAPAPGENLVVAGFRRLYTTLKHIRSYRELAKFLIAFLFYNDGIQTVIVMAAVFGAETLGMTQQELILSFILVQAVAFVGALIFGYLSDRLPTKTAITITLVIWSGAVLSALFIEESWQFWVLGAIIGLVLGGSQSASRALFARFVPAHKSAEFFGFFSISQKASALLGPLFFAVISGITGSTRYAIVSVIIFFLMGLFGLYFVDEKEGIRQGEEAESTE